MTKLVIVESPTKAATIKKYLGKGYTIAASVGHVRDLPQSRFAIDVDNGFAPEYISIRGKAQVINDLKKLAKEIGVEDRVRFLGFVTDDEVLKLYANALGVYCAPIDEDYGYISLEAFLSKRPVVTCDDSGGVLEFVKNDISGYVVKNQPEMIGEAINKLYQNKNKAQSMGIAGYDSVKDISWDNVIDELTKTIR